MHRLPILRPLVTLVAIGCHLPASAACASAVRDLAVGAPETPSLALRWIETGMRDGKPLHIDISDHPQGGLRLRFVKAGEGLWFETRATICSQAGRLEAQLPAGAVETGPAAPWLLRTALPAARRLVFSVSPLGRLQVAAAGWSGEFLAADAAGRETVP